MSKPQQSYALWIAGRVVRGLLILLVIAVCLLILWRAFLSDIPPKDMKRLTLNENLNAAYKAENGSLTLFTQEQASVTRSEKNYGYFGVSSFVFIKEADQLQVLFRFNNSTLEHVKEDYGLTDVPAAGDPALFDISVVTVTDLTPDNTADNVDGSPALLKKRIAPVSHTVDTTALYTYVRYIFDGVTVKEDTVTAFLDVYYRDDVDYAKEAYGTLRLYHKDSADLPVELSGKEEKALARGYY